MKEPHLKVRHKERKKARRKENTKCWFPLVWFGLKTDRGREVEFRKTPKADRSEGRYVFGSVVFCRRGVKIMCVRESVMMPEVKIVGMFNIDNSLVRCWSIAR